VKNLKKKILDSIKYAREELDFALISEEWGNAEHKCTCAMGCVLLKDNPKDTVRIEADKERCAAAAEILGVDEKWVDCFIEGFDGNGTAEQSANPEAWEMGWAIAKETNPIVYYLWDGEA
jgi:hypothetical protein